MQVRAPNGTSARTEALGTERGGLTGACAVGESRASPQVPRQVVQGSRLLQLQLLQSDAH